MSEPLFRKKNILKSLDGRAVYGFLKLLLFLLIFVGYPVYIFAFPLRDQPSVNKDTFYKLNDIFDIIGTKVDLPTDEVPAYIQLLDLTPFQNQPFFTRALPDDILILYTRHSLGILFDPVSNKIINMSSQFQLPSVATSSP